MARTNTYLLLTVNTAHSSFSKLRTEQKAAIVAMIGPDNIERGTGLYNKGMSGFTPLAGHVGRMQTDPKTIAAGRNGTTLPLERFQDLGIPMLNNLAELLRRGVLTVTLVNQGSESGDAGTLWRTGIPLSARELASRTIDPRALYENLAAAQAALAEPPNYLEQFLFLPRAPGSKLLIQVKASAATANSEVTLYGYNGNNLSIFEIETFTGISGSKLISVETDYPYVLPRLTAGPVGAGGETVDILVGFTLPRI